MEASRNTQDNATAQAELFHSTKCPGIHSAKEYKLIKRLAKGTVSRQELDELLDLANSPDAILRIRAKGWDIVTDRLPDIDREGQRRTVGYYWLASYQKECALEALDLYRQAFGGKHE
ncbi:helix-turn-helix domain-containing protein [Thiomicrorhabdus sp.]|uniref:helix-turn-helix domain-containing protein n=1 Tax=Thiomicrorhabdus sp. TaxID=2039724 RepID=UPI0029C7C46F|nr:helix-turn-helix domain-containing protein [Thiomicrorhabdus sp.]